MATRSERHKHRKKSGWIKKTVLGVLFFALLGVLIFAYQTFSATKNSIDDMYKFSKSTSKNKIETLKKDGAETKISILLMGLDNDSERNLGSTRTDSLIYLVYDGEAKEIQMVAIPRDIYTNIYDENGNIQFQSKINSAYTLNEEDSTIETVKNYLDLPVDYFATVNFISFKQIIDAVGGIEVDVPYDINEKYTTDNSGKVLIPKGKQHLNGEQALIFSRIRKVDDDIQRGNRQQEVIKATIKETLSINSIAKYQEILDSVRGNVRTNLTFDNLTSLAGNMLEGFEIKTNTFEWYDEYIGDESVIFIKDESYQQIRNQLLTSLGLPSDYTLHTDNVVNQY
ncbi:LCP family protein [Enterococcus saccharolyticus]|uniref:Transcription antiterminator n=1 Tax=Candidatus Enterococcus willemsii TaxID=1857215 RepID=A0ABQ6Z111_9ENTE|nr:MULTISPECIES: LCP family protein [Enterococcus]KAF1305060.1 transcription antiterminator [Enterococcus sp. CU12B]MCD5003493.1 LCP family protein [Enterococcus saccharolyticus]